MKLASLNQAGRDGQLIVVIKQLEGTGGLASPSASGQEMKQYAQTQIVKWRKVVQEANIPQQ